MNNERINELIRADAQAAVSLDFADLLRRIEKDNGASTAAQMTAPKSHTARAVVGTAAAVTATVALSAMAVVGIMSAGKSYEAAAPEAPMCDCAPPEDWYDSESMEWADVETSEDNSQVSGEEQVVSDSDVSDSDVSGSDADEE